MDDNKKVYLEYIKNDIKIKWDSGLIETPNAQYAYIENICKDLLMLDKPSITNVVGQYLEDQRSLQNKIESKNKELEGLFDDYRDNARLMIEEIRKL